VAIEHPQWVGQPGQDPGVHDAVERRGLQGREVSVQVELEVAVETLRRPGAGRDGVGAVDDGRRTALL